MAAKIASNSQQWIASQLSATAVDARPSRTKWTYVQDRNGMMVIEPVLGFYFNPPPNAKCRWSTEKGTRPPQLITKGLPLPQRSLVLWADHRLESEAARIREKYWDEMRTLVAPQRFEDLYEYFDSATLFMSGAVNLWNLINLLANDARHNWREVEKHVASECNNWVLDWLEVFPGAASNRESLIKWDMKGDILTAVTSQFDWDNDLKALDLVGQNILRECFLYHFERLTGKKPNVARFNTHAAEIKPTSAGEPTTAAAGPTAQASPSPDDSSLPASSVQPLSTIPEESAAIKTATKPDGLTIDTGLALQGPLQTVSAPATAVPRITVEPQTAKEAEDIPEKSDHKDKTEDDFLTNQDLADRVQSTARQLSSQSTPGERQDNMLNTSTSNIPPRAVSATEAAGVPQQAHRPQNSFERAGTVPRNMHGNKPPFQGPPKSPQGYGPNRQQLSTNMLALHGERSYLQQRNSSGPPQQQHIMQTFGPINNGMQPPPPGLVPPTSTQGMSSNPGGFPPSAPGLQLGVGPESMSGLPSMNFRNQMPMRPPTMGQPQSVHPQASSTNAPPHYMGQQNVGTPMYQPNGYIPQSQKQPRREKGDKKKRHDDRRDSMNSTGSRNKVRDDPIHGPVYNLKPGKDSNTPTGRKLSSSDGCTAVNPKQPALNPNFDCRNYRFEGKIKTPPFEFVDCSCSRCARSTKSLYVRHDKVSMEQAQTTLMNYLGAWGAMHVITSPDGFGSTVVFASDLDAIRCMQELCTRPNNGRDIPGMGHVSSLWYAYYSKHFTPPFGNPTGLPRGLLEAKGPRRRSSSTLSRDSNAYRNQLPHNMLSHTPSLGNYGPGPPPPHFWQGETGSQLGPNMVPVYQQFPQRALWDPDSADKNRKPSRAESQPKKGLEYQPKTYPKRPDGITALKEDWRSKPPAEEAIEDISSDEAVADNSSNVSSQGARSIKVCLPNETGSSRSRSVSPDIEDVQSPKQVRKDSPALQEGANQEGDHAERGQAQDSKAEVVAKDEGPTSSGYRKATAELAVPVEEFQPIAVAKQANPTGKSIGTGLTSYSKITSELTEATENFDINTVIRHKPPRSPLPEEWTASSEQEPSNLQSRLGALSGALQLEALGQEVGASVAEGTSVAMAPEPPKEEEAPAQKPKGKKTGHKSAKAGRNKSKASNDTSTSSSSATPTEAGASRASDHRPMSRTSSSRPESAAEGRTQSPARSQPATKKKKAKPQRKFKQPSTAEPSAAPAVETKTEESQDQIPKVSVKASPTKKPKIQESGPAKETPAHSASEPAKLGGDAEIESVVDTHDDRKKSDSSNKEGGSVCVKDQSPRKPPQTRGFNDERESLQKQAATDPQIAFEPAAETDPNNCSPEANLFPNQKFTIDKVKRDSAVATPPTAKESDVRHRQMSAMHFTTNDARIALPLLPPNSKPSGWASVAARGPRSKSDDPFTSVKGEPQPEDWLKDKAVKTPQKPSSEPASHQTSPTPSPKKKADHQGGRSRLNAAAKSFEPTSIPASPAASVVSVLSATAIPFHTKKPSLPGQKGPIEQRFVTPAEQVVDPTTVTQPGPPAKEEKRVGPAPVRGGDGGQKVRVKSSATASAATTSMKTAAQAASAVNIASKLVDEEEFPTLAAAAAVPQRRVSSAVKASVPGTGARSKTTTAAAPKASAAAPAPAPKPPVTSPNNTKLGPRGDTSVPAADKQGVGVGEKGKAGEDQWTTVGSGKKTGGKKNSNGNNNRTASGKSGGGATGQGGRAGGQGPRSGRAPVGEERKGG